MWKAFVSRGDNGDANDTNALIAEIVKLRAERAKLLGFPTHAHWRMENTMAKDPAKAMDLMMRVWPAAVARVNEEVRDMTALARKQGFKRHDRAVGLSLLPGEGPQRPLRPQPGRAEALFRAR